MDVSPLFEPVKIAGLQLRNRFVMPAMQRQLTVDGVPGPEMVEYYRERAAGGIALAIGEGTAINHPTSTQYLKYALFHEKARDGWRRVLDAVKPHGTRMFIQLYHEGATRRPGSGPSPDAESISPSGYVTATHRQGRAMSAAELDDIKAAFVADAQLVQSMGFDGVEIHGGHGYLLDQFLWADTNVREDRYGGSLEARARFPCEVIVAVRAAVGPQFPISFRMSQWKIWQFDAKIAASPAELETLLGLLKMAGVDIFHASARRFWLPEFEGSDRTYAGWVKALSKSPVIAVGSVGLNDELLNSLAGGDAQSTGAAGLAELMRRYTLGEFDLVAVGRSCLGDPEWVSKVGSGRYGDLKPFSGDMLSFVRQ